MQKLCIGLASCLVICLLSFIVYTLSDITFIKKEASSQSLNIAASEPIKTSQQLTYRIKSPARLFGINVDSLHVISDTVKDGESVSTILQSHNISSQKIEELRHKSKGVFNLRHIQAGRPYTLLCEKDYEQTVCYFIYQPSAREYIVFSLNDSISIYKEEKKVQTLERALAGRIESSLYVAMSKAGCTPALINHFADIFSWKVNFMAVQPGDAFKLIYEEHFLEGVSIGYGKVKAAYFYHNGEHMYAILFGEGKKEGYYDRQGKSLQKAFLKEPLEYSRISSRFSRKRLHPVQKRYKAHLGTDFAAPRGTPIRSVGEGVVVEKGYNRGNGNYVKIRHDNTYSTQYLHMSRFASGIKRGVHVGMGQTVGYVGSTGLATGPHLCYRFWKNGKQVDALREKLPSAKPLEEKYKEEFSKLSAEMIVQLEKIKAQGQESPERVIAEEESMVDADM